MQTNSFRNYKIFQMIESYFVYNFLIIMLMEYSLQMIICSFVNIMQY